MELRLTERKILSLSFTASSTGKQSGLIFTEQVDLTARTWDPSTISPSLFLERMMAAFQVESSMSSMSEVLTAAGLTSRLEMSSESGLRAPIPLFFLKASGMMTLAWGENMEILECQYCPALKKAYELEIVLRRGVIASPSLVFENSRKEKNFI